MDKLHATMVKTCDRLLSLLTGPHAVTDPAAAEAALEAIGLLQTLEGQLKGAASHPGIDQAALGRFRHWPEVSLHVTDVFQVLREEGLYRPAPGGKFIQ
ncbi:MAG TPA: hypothetical protein VJ576_02375 [Rhodocyclaceae bacterium]|nr:hypothetical protein [Rhodocyclaceae bacterium]